MLQFVKFRRSQNLIENGGLSGINKSYKLMPLASKVAFFFIFYDVSIFSLVEFLDRRSVSPKSQRSATLADNLIPVGSFGARRRERQCVGEEKEEGLLRTVVCVFKS